MGCCQNKIVLLVGGDQGCRQLASFIEPGNTIKELYKHHCTRGVDPWTETMDSGGFDRAELSSAAMNDANGSRIHIGAGSTQ
ncbi:MAG TPA: hypothetical protein PKC47_07675 [Petrimonas sp.]|nr:hypothetical protein [Petrimonas sp.]